MAIGTGAVSLTAIQTEYGGSNPISLGEYYRGGGTGYVPIGTPNGGYGLIGTTGNPLSMVTFRGTSAVATINLVISSHTPNYNIRTAAGSPAVVANVTVTINSGIYVYATSTGGFAMDTGTGWTAGSTITIINNGAIIGMGGAGGNGATVPNAVLNSFGGATAGAAGGTALRAQYAVTVYNSAGTVGGGGGGGGGGGASKADYSSKTTNTYGAPGGGGGGGRSGLTNSAGGAGSTAVGCTNNLTSGAGNAGTNSSAGVGGVRAAIGSTIASGAGGTGGAWGSAGSSGSNPDTSVPAYYTLGWTGGAAGGAAGDCTSGNSNITWASTGARWGTLA